jgi:hypothetical protein
LAGLEAQIAAVDLKFDAQTQAVDAQKLALDMRGTLDRALARLDLRRAMGATAVETP